jgi:ketosteroid isomerase-like protein
MAGNVDTLKRAYQAYSQGDLDGAFENATDDFRWEGPNADELPGGGTHEGKDATKQMAAKIPEAWDDFSVEPDEWIESGDTVIVLGHSSGTPKGGDRVKVPFVHVWRYNDEGKATRVQILTDTKVVADAMGV